MSSSVSLLIRLRVTNTHLSALDNLQSIQMRSEEQDRMLKMLEAKFKKSKLISKRQDANIEAIRAKYLVRTDQTFKLMQILPGICRMDPN